MKRKRNRRVVLTVSLTFYIVSILTMVFTVLMGEPALVTASIILYIFGTFFFLMHGILRK